MIVVVKKLPKKCQLVYEFLQAYSRMHGMPPSYEVVAKSLGLSAKSNIHRIVHRLKDEGLITVKAYKFHSVKLIDRSVEEIKNL